MAIDGSDIQYGPWVGGVWYSRPEEDVAEDEISSMENMRVQAAGAVEKRAGTASYRAQAAIATNPTCTMLAEFTIPPSTTEVVTVFGDKLYRDNGTIWADITGGVITITAGDDNTFEWAVDEANGVILATNNVDAPIKYGGASADLGSGAGVPVLADVDSQFTTAAHVAFWDNRAWWGNVDTNYDRLFYSDIADIDTVGATSFYQFGHPITALISTRNALTVHTTGGIFTMVPTGNVDVPYQQQQRTSRAALNGRANVVLPGDRQLMLREDGIYLWDGGDDLEKKSYQLDLGYWPSVFANESRLAQTFAVYFPREAEAWFWLPYGTSQTQMNHIMVYSDRHDCWFGPYTGSTSHFYRNCATLIGGKPHAGTLNSSGSIGGKVEDHEPANTFNDDDGSAGGAAIRAYFRTGAPAPEGSGVRLRWLYTRTYYDATGNYDVTLNQESSGISGTSETLNVAGGGFTLDQGKLDEDQLGTVRMLAFDTNLTEYDPHSSIKFTNNSIDEFFRIRRTHPTFKVIGRKRRINAGVS